MTTNNDVIVKLVCPFGKAGCFMADLRECTVVNQYFRDHHAYWSSPRKPAYNKLMQEKSIKGGRAGAQARNASFAAKRAER